LNADTLCNLVEANEGGRYNKLIVMQLGAILEAALDQIIYRAQNYNVEGVPNISESERLEIENKKVERFNAVINVLKAHKLPDALGNDIYDEIHKLRRYRNKIHIQDDDQSTYITLCKAAHDTKPKLETRFRKFSRSGLRPT
jgi:hypothetical protein